MRPGGSPKEGKEDQAVQEKKNKRANDIWSQPEHHEQGLKNPNPVSKSRGRATLVGNLGKEPSSHAYEVLPGGIRSLLGTTGID